MRAPGGAWPCSPLRDSARCENRRSGGRRPRPVPACSGSGHRPGRTCGLRRPLRTPVGDATRVVTPTGSEQRSRCPASDLLKRQEAASASARRDGQSPGHMHVSTAAPRLIACLASGAVERRAGQGTAWARMSATLSNTRPRPRAEPRQTPVLVVPGPFWPALPKARIGVEPSFRS